MNECGVSYLIHGPSKSGKTYLADTAPAPRLLLDAEGNSRFLRSKRIKWNPVTEAPPQAGDWNTCISLIRDFGTISYAYQWLASGKHPFKSVILDSISESQQRCFSADTEILTSTGWKFISDVTTNDLVAQWWWSGNISFDHPTDTQSYPYEGNLVHIQGRSTDILITPDHRQPVRTRFGTPSVREAKDLIPGLEFPVSGLYWGDENFCPLTSDQIRLLVSFKADGTYPNENQIYWTFRKTRKIERLRYLLTVLKIPFKESQYSNSTTRFWVHKDNAPFLTKNWNWSILQWSLKQRRTLLSEIAHWDGEVKYAGTDRITFFNNSQDQIDIISAVSVLSGYATSSYTAQQNQAKKVQSVLTQWRSPKQFSNYPYSGKVFCLSVPSTFLLIRRNGKIGISGNCIDAIAGDEQLKMQQWGELLRKMSQLVRQYRDLLVHPTNPLSCVVFTAMTKQDKAGKFSPFVQGQLATSMPYYIDVIGYLKATMDESNVFTNFLLTKPHDLYEAGDRTGLYPTIITNPNLSDMVEMVCNET